MSQTLEHAAAIALMRAGRRRQHEYVALLEQRRSALAILEEERGLLAHESLPGIEEELLEWRSRGITVATVLDHEYPPLLRAAADRPPVIFIAGRLTPAERRSVAVVGSRRASASAISVAREVSWELVDAGYTVVSGLAAGIDSAAHAAALEHDGRTVAVIGTGLERCYPPQNAALQRRIAAAGAVVSRFLPAEPPRKSHFPLRNAVISGLSLATVVVDASATSGCRIVARLALAQGRPLVLFESLLAHEWARALATDGRAHVVTAPVELLTVLATNCGFREGEIRAPTGSGEHGDGLGADGGVARIPARAPNG